MALPFIEWDFERDAPIFYAIDTGAKAARRRDRDGASGAFAPITVGAYGRTSRGASNIGAGHADIQKLALVHHFELLLGRIGR
jgi:hypothetical protein